MKRLLSLLFIGLLSAGSAFAEADPHATDGPDAQAPSGHAEPHGDEHGGDHAEPHGDEHGDEHGGDHAEPHGDDHGDEHGATPIPLKDIGFHAFNFVLMYVVLFFLARKPVAELLKQRQSSIRQDLEGSARDLEVAKERYDSLVKKLAAFDDELSAMKNEARQDAEQERLYIAERTERDAMMLREMTAGAAREETRKAHAELQKNAVDLAVKLAEEKLRAEIATSDHQRLANEFLSVLKEDAHA